MTDRLLQIAREAQSAREAQAPKVRSAFDEAVLAAARDQAKINAQQFSARESASGHLAAARSEANVPWWKAWPVWAGSGSFAAVIASVLLITGQPAQKSLPEQSKNATENAPVMARAEVPAVIPAEAPAIVTAPATASASASVTAPASSSSSSSTSNPSRAATAGSPPAPNDGTVALKAAKVSSAVQADSALPASRPPAPMPAPMPARMPATAPIAATGPPPAAAPVPPPAIPGAQSSGVAEASGLAQSKRAEIRVLPKFAAPQTAEQCATDIRALSQDRRSAADLIWLRLAGYCKSTFPATQWPADLGAINSTNIEPVKE